MSFATGKWIRRTGAVIAVAALTLLVGFFLFAAFATRPVDLERVTADGIVVLTGGGRRIEAAGKLLEEGRGQRLLISGVNRIATRRDLLRLTGLSEHTYACCVDIDHEAADTMGNARETRDWLKKHNYRSVIVVTASYHMPRSLIELVRTSPGIRFHAYPVTPKAFGRSPWWLEPIKIRTLMAEYLKFLPAAGRFVVARAWTLSDPAGSYPASDPMPPTNIGRSS